MQNNNSIQRSIHQQVERIMRHRLALLLVVGFMGIAILHFDTHVVRVARQAYNQGFGWIGMYTRHEHPTHGGLDVAINRVPTISGSN